MYKKLNNSSFDVSRDISNRIFSIPIHPYLNAQDMEHIIETIKKFDSPND